MAEAPRIVTVRIDCVELPEPNWGGHGGIWIGIQSGDEVVQRVQLPSEAITFEAELRVGSDDSEPSPNFLGPFAHGPKGERFLYICWGGVHLGAWVGFRRAKLPLKGLTWTDIQSNEARGTLRCTDAKGGPICATVKSDHFRWTTP